MWFRYNFATYVDLECGRRLVHVVEKWSILPKNRNRFWVSTFRICEVCTCVNQNIALDFGCDSSGMQTHFDHNDIITNHANLFGNDKICDTFCLCHAHFLNRICSETYNLFAPLKLTETDRIIKWNHELESRSQPCSILMDVWLHSTKIRC